MNSASRYVQNLKGFTLLELILVLFLIALISGLTVPFVGATLDRFSVQSAAREITSALRFARSQAITLKTLFTFNGDLSQNQYWLTNPSADESTKIKQVDDSVNLAEFKNAKEIRSDGTFTIRFYPRGNSSGGSIRLEQTKEKDSDTFYVIQIDPITGNPKIEEKKS